MLCIRSHNTDPFFNLAAEEYLLRNSDDDYFILWKSNPVVVCGKHQNTYAEINYPYITTNQIQVARRLTGGGTVFHDPGNINFTFIKNGHVGSLVQFSRFTEPVIEFLNSIGIQAVPGPKHDIVVNGKKISGNAEHVFKNRVLHHGTLLFDANLDMLRKSIVRNHGTYIDKSVQSNRSSVMNISTALPSVFSNELFCDQLFSFLKSQSAGIEYMLNDQESKAIQTLAEKKYRTWEWIYGWSPDYTYKNQWLSGNLSLEIELDIHRGIITAARCSGTFADLMENLNEMLKGTAHQEKEIRTLLESMGVHLHLGNNGIFNDLIFALF